MLEINLNPFPNLQTTKLKLRQITDKDVAEILFQRSDPTIMQYLDRKKAENEADAQEFIAKVQKGFEENEGITWGICLHNSEKLIGNIGLWRFDIPNHRAELGYALHPQYWGQGIMSEAMQAVLNYGFNTLKFHSLEANINPANVASRKLLEKHGFVQEAYFKEDYYFEGKFLDSVILSLIDPCTRKPANDQV
jgi:ribosomal-protein-alanine N-acetyltransferase